VAGGRGLTWCPQWWMHAEAIARLMALWEAWEALRLDGGTAMGTWWRDHCGPQLGVLMNGEEGPLHLCKPDHHGGIPAPLKSAPAGPHQNGGDQPGAGPDARSALLPRASQRRQGRIDRLVPSLGGVPKGRVSIRGELVGSFARGRCCSVRTRRVPTRCATTVGYVEGRAQDEVAVR